MSFDLIYTIALFSLAALVALLYSLRVLFKGRAQFDRVDRQGASPLLGKSMMEGGYWFMQPLGRLLCFLHITPNQLSWASFFFGLAAGVCLAVGHFGFGAGFAAISALLDSLDGIVARLTKVASDAGEVLDATVDRYVEFFFLAGLVVYYREVPVLMILTLLALIGSFMVSYSSAKAEALQVEPPKGSMRRPERAIYLTLGAALCPVTIPMFEVIREYPIAIGHPMVIALGLVAVIGNVSAAERLYAIAKMVRTRENEAAEARRKALAESHDAHDGQDDVEAAPAPVKLR